MREVQKDLKLTLWFLFKKYPKDSTNASELHQICVLIYFNF